MPDCGGVQLAVAPTAQGCWNEVQIRKVENGFIVTVGCKQFVSTSWAEVSKALGEYYADPVKARKKYAKD